MRPNDRLLKVGVSPFDSDPLDFFVMSNDVLSTLSKKEADRMVREEGESIVNVVQVPVMTFNQVMEIEFDSPPDFVSLDVEGLDCEILQTYDFSRCKPLAWCLETISYSATGQGVKDREQQQILEAQGYMLYADTYVNSIFVDADRWNNRHATN